MSDLHNDQFSRKGEEVELKDYIAIRRAYNLVRQDTPKNERLTFEEFAILCRLELADTGLRTSDIAQYQSALRPTMTHRTNHLAAQALIDRAEGDEDRRSVMCAITDAGHARVDGLCKACCEVLHGGTVLTRIEPGRVRRYVDAMGALYIKASNLILIAMLENDGGPMRIGRIASALGLLQPTVSMSINSLIADEYITRSDNVLTLTDKGRAVADDYAKQIDEIVVRRDRR